MQMGDDKERGHLFGCKYVQVIKVLVYDTNIRRAEVYVAVPARRHAVRGLAEEVPVGN